MAAIMAGTLRLVQPESGVGCRGTERSELGFSRWSDNFTAMHGSPLFHSSRNSTGSNPSLR